MMDDVDAEEVPLQLDIITMETWPPMLPRYIAEYEVSISQSNPPLYDLEEIALTFQLTLERIEKFKEQTAFRAEVRAAILEIKDSDSVIKRKARAQAELYLDVWVPKAMTDPNFPAAEKNKLFMFVSKMGRIIDDPQEKLKLDSESKLEGDNNQTTPTIVINLSSSNSLKDTKGITITQQPERLIND